MIGRAALIALVLAQAFILVLGALIPSRVVASHGMIGFPLFHHFDIDRYFRWYWLQGVAFPLLAFLLYRRLRGPAPALPETGPSGGLPAALPPRLFFTGAVLGLGTAPWRGDWPFALQVIAAGALVAGGALGLARRYALAPAALHLLLLPFVWFSFAGASAATRALAPSGPVAAPWFPWWLAAGLALATFVWVLPRLRDEAVERRLFLALAVPAALYLLWAELPGGRQWLHPLHDGETLVTSRLVREGAFPWRDFLFQHGLLQDPLAGLLGHLLFGDSVWGTDAGLFLVAKPLFYVSQYVLLLYLLGSGSPWLWLGAGLLPLVHPLFFDAFNLRFLPAPLVFVALGRTLETTARRWPLLLGAGLAGSFILTPEFVVAPPVILLALFLHERLRGTGHRRSRLCWLGAAAVGALWLGFLAANGAVEAYLRCYLDVADAHRYGTGIPIRWDLAPWFPLAVALPVAAHFLAVFYLAGRPRFTSRDTVMAAWCGFCFLYFAKFLARADEHILAHVGLALPVFYWLASRLPRAAWVGAAVLVAVGVGWRQTLWITVDRFPDRLARRVGEQATFPRWGYGPIPRNSERILTELGDFFRENGREGDRVFDFTIEPALFHYLLDLRPALRHHYPYTNPRTQRAIVSELERERPEWVVYLSSLGYARIDGVPAMVRYHEISRHLIERYRIHAVFDHHVLLLRRDLVRPSARGKGLLARERAYDFEACDWGYALHHLSERWRGEGREIPFQTRRGTDGYVTELRLPPATGGRFLEVELEETNGDRFRLTDGRLRGENAYIGFHTLPSGPRSYVIPVESCLQWAGFRGDTLYLHHRRPQKIAAVRWIGATRAYGGGRKPGAPAGG